MDSTTFPSEATSEPAQTALPAAAPPLLDQRKQRKTLAWLVGFCAWIQRWLFGALFCVTHIGGVVVFGWTYRWMQGLVLWQWWKHSRFAKEGSFRDFCNQLEGPAPVQRPRWIWRDSPAAKNRRNVWYMLTIPWHGLWLNFKTGVSGLFCTYLLTGWGCLLLFFGWIYGWQISFYKGYEEAGFGLVISLTGVLLFVVAMFHVLLAQVHQAFTGERRAFFDFRLIRQLLRAKPLAYLGLVVLVSILSLPMLLFELIVIGGEFIGNDPQLTDAELLWRFIGYVFLCCLLFFPMYLLTRRVAARIYAAAVLKVLQNGWISHADLHPKVRHWLERLEILPVPVLTTTGIGQALKKGSGRFARALMYSAMFLVLVLWVFATFHVSQFFNYRHGYGFLNHRMVQIPNFGIIPQRLFDVVWD